MKKITSIYELRQEIESGNYNYYGIRNVTENDLTNFERGYLDCSADFVDGEPTGEILPGTCAIGVCEYMSDEEITEICEFVKRFYPNTGIIVLVADSREEYGNDDGEVILGHDGYGADVISTIEL